MKLLIKITGLLSLAMLQMANADLPDNIKLNLFASDFERPVAVRHAQDGSGRLFVVEQAGQIIVIDATGQTLETPFLDITARVDDSENEQGLLGLAFAPDFATSGYFYVNYTRDLGGQNLDRTRIARFKVSADPDVADASSEFVILEIEQDDWNHNGGDIHFSPIDGYLYIGMGDGGGSNDTFNNAQPLDELNGKMLRIDVSASDTNDNACGLISNYRIPADNPFTDGACPEIWANGLRNPWRWSFDRLMGAIFIGDVGQNAIEEINFQPASSTGGENYGWPCFEGNSARPNNPSCLAGTLTPPLLTYAQDNIHCSVTGGYRYRGTITALTGIYFFADFCSGYIWYVESGNWNNPQLWLDTSLRISSFGEDEQAELYIVDLRGSIYRIEATVEGLIVMDDFE